MPVSKQFADRLAKLVRERETAHYPRAGSGSGASLIGRFNSAAAVARTISAYHIQA